MQNEPTDPQVELREQVEDMAMKYNIPLADLESLIDQLLTTERERAFELGKKVEAENCVDYTIQICQQLQGAISRVGREHENEGEGKVVDSLQNAKNIIQEHLTAEQVRKEPRYFHALSKNVTYEEALKMVIVITIVTVVIVGVMALLGLNQ